MTILSRESPHNWAVDGASILRTIYDVMLQGLYIMTNATKRDERAQLFFDYMDIERKRRIDDLDASRTDMARHVSGSAKRPGAEPGLIQRFNAVLPKFVKTNGEPRQYWYPGNLKKLAKAFLVVGVLGGLLFPQTASAVAHPGGGEVGTPGGTVRLPEAVCTLLKGLPVPDGIIAFLCGTGS